jgi:hypothetical protein
MRLLLILSLLLAPVESRIRSIENLIRSLSKETAIVFDLEGNELGSLSGTEDGFFAPFVVIRLMKDKIVTHNHPTRNLPYFSLRDIVFASYANVQQMRVVGWLNNQAYLCIADRGKALTWATGFPPLDDRNLNQQKEDPALDWQVNNNPRVEWEILFRVWGIDYHCEYV